MEAGREAAVRSPPRKASQGLPTPQEQHSPECRHTAAQTDSTISGDTSTVSGYACSSLDPVALRRLPRATEDGQAQDAPMRINTLDRGPTSGGVLMFLLLLAASEAILAVPGTRDKIEPLQGMVNTECSVGECKNGKCRFKDCGVSTWLECKCGPPGDNLGHAHAVLFFTKIQPLMPCDRCY